VRDELEAKPEWKTHYRAQSLVFGDKADVVPLQAADIGAWEARRYCLMEHKKTKAELRKSLEAMLRSIPHASEYYDKAELVRYASFITSRRAPATEGA
jgi:hypothetical protein